MIIFEIFRSTTKANNQSDYVLGENVILLQVKDGTARIIDLDGEYHAISVTAALILLETLKNGSQKVAERLANEYSIELSQAQEDVRFFLQYLTDKRIIYHLETSKEQDKINKYNLLFFLEFLLKLINRSSINFEIKVWIILSLAYFSFRLLGWTKTIKVWQHSFSSTIIVNVQEKDKFINAVDLAIHNVTPYHLLNIECKERALCSWWMLCFAGIPAKLTLGVDLFPLSSHCWCEVGKNIVGDNKEWREWFTPVFSWE